MPGNLNLNIGNIAGKIFDKKCKHEIESNKNMKKS